MTWNGEEVTISDNWPINGVHFATLDGYDPTPWDSETPATGIHSMAESGDSPMQAACALIQRFIDFGICGPGGSSDTAEYRQPWPW